MKLNKNIAVSDTGFIFDPTTGNSFTTNHCGLQVIRLLKEGHSLEEIEQELTAEYDASPEILNRDLLDFTGMLQRLRLTE